MDTNSFGSCEFVDFGVWNLGLGSGKAGAIAKSQDGTRILPKKLGATNRWINCSRFCREGKSRAQGQVGTSLEASLVRTDALQNRGCAAGTVYPLFTDHQDAFPHV